MNSESLAWTAVKLLCLSGMAFGIVACEGTASSPVDHGVLFDDQLATLDAVSPHTRFDGAWGSLITATGWAPPEEEADGFFSWTLDGESFAFFVLPAGIEQLDLWASSAPFTYDESPGQSVTLYLNGTRVRTVELSAGWQELRVPLPDESLKSGLNEIRMQFAHAVRPVDVGLNADTRRLAARFRALAVVPRSVKRSWDFLAAAKAFPQRGEIELPLGGGYSLPLPPSSEVTIRAELTPSRCRNCSVIAELLTPGGEVRALETIAVPGALRLRVETSAEYLSHIRLRVVATAADFNAGSRVRVRFQERALRVRNRQRQKPDLPHVFIYMIDTLRADALEPYGAPDGFSPYIEAFARDATTYEKAWTASSWTLPATVSLLTGSLPRVHGIMRGDVKFSSENRAEPLALWLSDQGYDSVAISHSFVAGDSFGLHTGFSDFFLSNQLNARALRSQRARNLLVRWLSSTPRGTNPIFAYIHTVDPHAPYAPRGHYRRLADKTPGKLSSEAYLPSVFLTKELERGSPEIAHLRALYQGEVQFADFQFGRFVRTLKYLRLYRDSLVAVVSDHGEEFGEHGGFDHGRTVYEEMLRIPLIVKYPGDRGAGEKVSAPVSSIDLASTICVLVASESTGCDRFDGKPLPIDAATGRRALVSEVNPAPSERLREVDYEALLIENTKCILSNNRIDQFGNPIPGWQVYDLTRDPGETLPLDPESKLAETCIKALARLERASESKEASQHTQEKDLEKLRALGYIR